MATAGIIKRLGGPAIDEAGALLQEFIRVGRVALYPRLARLVRDAQMKWQDAGLDPKAVPLRTLLPLLEAGSREDDSDLAEMWSSLLASAAVNPEAVPPHYVQILASLSPLDSRILDAVCRREREVGRTAMWTLHELDLQDDVPGGAILVSLENLARQRLLMAQPINSGRQETINAWRDDESIRGISVTLTFQGRKLLEVCQAPLSASRTRTVADPACADPAK
jgi:hypothetical protein